MTTFIKTTKLKKSDDQTNIDKYSVAANVIKYHGKSKLIILRIIIPKSMKIIIFSCKNINNQNV